MGGSEVDVLLFFGVFRQCGGVEHFLDGKFGGVCFQLLLNFIVTSADEVVVDGEACAAQFGENLFGEFVIACGDVANLFFAFLGVLIHGKDSKDDVLVLHVGCLKKLLEAIPVFCRVAGVKFGFEIVFLQALADIFFGGLLTFLCQRSVHFH